MKPLLTLILASMLFLPQALLAAPEVGDKAPAFSLPGSDGKTYTLDQFAGEKPVVLAFFPKVFTGG